jgi:hypothetical protein
MGSGLLHLRHIIIYSIATVGIASVCIKVRKRDGGRKSNISLLGTTHCQGF